MTELQPLRASYILGKGLQLNDEAHALNVKCTRFHQQLKAFQGVGPRPTPLYTHPQISIALHIRQWRAQYDAE